MSWGRGICGALIKGVVWLSLPEVFIPWIAPHSKIQDGEGLFLFQMREGEPRLWVCPDMIWF